MGTNDALLRAALKAVAMHKRDGQIAHCDKAGRRVTARHQRLGAVSERLMGGLKAYRKGLGELENLAAEVQAAFTFDIRGFLQDKVEKNADRGRKVKDIANLASEIISLAAKRRDPGFQAASARFIQNTRGLYKDALETIAAGRKRIQGAVAKSFRLREIHQLSETRSTKLEQLKWASSKLLLGMRMHQLRSKKP
jgi:hypothetical protein